MKISAILDKIDENQLFIPAFQREYVWKRDRFADQRIPDRNYADLGDCKSS